MVYSNPPTLATTNVETMPRELDSRASDGIHVGLLWHPHDSHVSVAVSDTKTGEAFELDVRPGQRPLAVFHHPYAYAAQSSSIAHEGDEAGTACRS
jgi:hypothetical protein